jgi:alpha-methylacyl-CoA racemase
MSVGPLEPQFYAELLRLLELDPQIASDAAAARVALRERFLSRTQAEWTAIFDGTDACVAPVLPFTEAVEHPHMAARGVFVEHEGHVQPAPAPRFSRTEPTLTTGPSRVGGDTRGALEAWGVSGVDKLLASGAATQS